MGKLYNKEDDFFQEEDTNLSTSAPSVIESEEDIKAEKERKEMIESIKPIEGPIFTTGKTKNIFDITHTSLSPLRTTLTGGNFKAKYKAQIENIVFSQSSVIDPEDIFALLVLVEMVKEGKYPIKLKGDGFKRLLPSITDVLDNFIRNNKPVLIGVLNMFKGTTELPSGEGALDE